MNENNIEDDVKLSKTDIKLITEDLQEIKEQLPELKGLVRITQKTVEELFKLLAETEDYEMIEDKVDSINFDLEQLHENIPEQINKAKHFG